RGTTTSTAKAGGTTPTAGTGCAGNCPGPIGPGRSATGASEIPGEFAGHAGAPPGSHWPRQRTTLGQWDPGVTPGMPLPFPPFPVPPAKGQRLAPRLYRRQLQAGLLNALGDTPAVCLAGASRTGKSTLLRALQAELPAAACHSFADPAVRAGATRDPAGFLEGLPALAFLDDVDRV